MTDDERLLLICVAQMVVAGGRPPEDMLIKLQTLINHVEAEDPSGLKMGRLYRDEWTPQSRDQNALS
jgi:hypothetical protein